MQIRPIGISDLAGVFAVPPLARRHDARRSIDPMANDRIRDHIAAGGITRLLYGGNAFLYHLTLDEYGELLDWMAAAPGDLWMIPSVGPSYGRAIDQAARLGRHPFPAAMLLPCGDPRDAAGLEAGAREIADAIGVPLILYIKERDNWGRDEVRGLDAVARLVDEGTAVSIKYAVVRDDPADDRYLAALLERVDRGRVVSGIGERPAVVHMEQWRLPGFTTGSGCIAPGTSQAIFEACRAGDFDQARRLREPFLPLEDLRDGWGPARVLHAAAELAGISATGPIPPYITALDDAQHMQLGPIAKALASFSNTRTDRVQFFS